jgi:3-hydroxyacyl-[acyl-carrier-protein] dehydratase
MTGQEQVNLILKAVPQRYPFLMIDRILEQEYLKKAVCRKNVTQGEEILAGHFPGNPIFPGVLMIEMGLQATQIMLTDLEKLKTSSGPVTEAPQGYLLSVDKFKFLKVVRPGDVIEVTSTLDMQALGMAKANIRLLNEKGEELAHGIVTVSASDAAAGA